MPRLAAGVAILAILFAVPATSRAALTTLDEVLVFATPSFWVRNLERPLT